MFIDYNLRVSENQAVTTTIESTNTIDLGVARELGEGNALEFHITPTATVTAAGAATVTFEVIGATNAALNAGVVVLGKSEAIAKSALAASVALNGVPATPIVVAFNPFITSLGARYLGVRYTIGIGPLTAGTFTADLVVNLQGNRKHYPSGVTIS